MQSNHGGRSGWWLLALIGLMAYSWSVTGLRPFTLPIDVAVGVPTLILLGLSWRRSRLGRVEADPGTRPPRGSVVVWAALIGALTVWELAAYVASPRSDHPTLSSIADDITSVHAARAAVFALWLLIGFRLFARTNVPQRGGA